MSDCKVNVVERAAAKLSSKVNTIPWCVALICPHLRSALPQVVQDPEECYAVVLVAWAGLAFATDKLLLPPSTSTQVQLLRPQLYLKCKTLRGVWAKDLLFNSASPAIYSGEL